LQKGGKEKWEGEKGKNSYITDEKEPRGYPSSRGGGGSESNSFLIGGKGKESTGREKERISMLRIERDWEGGANLTFCRRGKRGEREGDPLASLIRGR